MSQYTYTPAMPWDVDARVVRSDGQEFRATGARSLEYICKDQDTDTDTRNTVTDGSGSDNITIVESFNPDGTINYTVTGTDENTQNLVVDGDPNDSVEVVGTPNGDGTSTFSVTGTDTRNVVVDGDVNDNVLIVSTPNPDGSTAYTVTATDANTQNTITDGDPNDNLFVATSTNPDGSTNYTITATDTDTDTDTRNVVEDGAPDDNITVTATANAAGTTTYSITGTDENTHSVVVDGDPSDSVVVSASVDASGTPVYTVTATDTNTQNTVSDGDPNDGIEITETDNPDGTKDYSIVGTVVDSDTQDGYSRVNDYAGSRVSEEGDAVSGADVYIDYYDADGNYIYSQAVLTPADVPQPETAAAAGIDVYGVPYSVGSNIIRWPDGRAVCVDKAAAPDPVTATAVDFDLGVISGPVGTQVSGNVSTNDTACSAGTTTYEATGTPVNGVLDSLDAATGEYTFTPAAAGVFSFTYQISCDGTPLSTATESGTLEVPVVPVTATAVDFDLGTIAGPVGTQVSGNVSTNDTACSVGTTTYAVTGTPVNGTVDSFDTTTGAYTFTPASAGVFSFTYDILCDGVVTSSASESGTLEVPVTAQVVCGHISQGFDRGVASAETGPDGEAIFTSEYPTTDGNWSLVTTITPVTGTVNNPEVIAVDSWRFQMDQTQPSSYTARAELNVTPEVTPAGCTGKSLLRIFHTDFDFAEQTVSNFDGSHSTLTPLDAGDWRDPPPPAASGPTAFGVAARLIWNFEEASDGDFVSYDVAITTTPGNELLSGSTFIAYQKPVDATVENGVIVSAIYADGSAVDAADLASIVLE